MAYDIELISIGDDSYPILRDSAVLLNTVQREFRFHLPSLALQQDGMSFVREKYLTADIWAFLREQRKKFGGNRPYILAFVNAPLQSSELNNIFGSHEATEGLAVVTLHSSAQYVRETRRYCCYYMTRYSLSFVNPLIKAHSDEARTKCYFHKKLYKPDIRESMDSGWICDQDQHQLDNPPPESGAKALSQEEREALRCMRQVVKGDYPHAVIMKGGGVKGLAFAGALLELKKYFWFDCHVGASAGAIAAVLLAAGYSPAELVDILSSKNFRDFMDAPLWRVPINLLSRGGCYPGKHFSLWIGTMLRAKIPKQSEILMSDLNGAVIYASRRGPGTVTFDSAGQRKDTVAAFAARCSMSIPIFFIPQHLDGRRVYDGGLRNNFPVSRFLTDHAEKPFIALYLSAGNSEEQRWMGTELVNIWIDGEERQVVDSNVGSVVVIDTSPVGTIDFNLEQIEKEFLLKIGRASALTFLQNRRLDDGPDAATVESARTDAETCRQAVMRMRTKRRTRRVLSGLAILIVLGVATYIVPRAAWALPDRVEFHRIELPQLDQTYVGLAHELVNEADRDSDDNTRSRPSVLLLTWKRPLLFQAKRFGLQIRSDSYEIHGFAASQMSGSEDKAVSPCRTTPKSIGINLQTPPEKAYVFIRLRIPIADSYNLESFNRDTHVEVGSVDEICAIVTK